MDGGGLVVKERDVDDPGLVDSGGFSEKERDMGGGAAVEDVEAPPMQNGGFEALVALGKVQSEPRNDSPEKSERHVLFRDAALAVPVDGEYDGAWTAAASWTQSGGRGLQRVEATSDWVRAGERGPISELVGPHNHRRSLYWRWTKMTGGQFSVGG